MGLCLGQADHFQYHYLIIDACYPHLENQPHCLCSFCLYLDAVSDAISYAAILYYDRKLDDK